MNFLLLLMIVLFTVELYRCELSTIINDCIVHCSSYIDVNFLLLLMIDYE